MSIQAVIDNAQAISKDRRTNIDVTRTLGGVVKYSRSGPYLTTFSITPSYPTQAEHDAFTAQLGQHLLGPYNVSFSNFTVRTNGEFFNHSHVATVNGGGQTGTTINIDGLQPLVNNVFAAGDTIQITGVPFTYIVLNNVSSNGSGQVTLTLDQPLAASPVNNAQVSVGSDIIWSLFLEQVPAELGSARLPFNVSYGGQFILREGTT